MQKTTSPSSNTAVWLTTYGPLILSILACLIIAAAWFLGRVDTNIALDAIGAILVGNGLISATQWQAVPGLAGSLQPLLTQLISHIQTLHAQQAAVQQASVSQLVTARMPAVQAPVAPPVASPVAQQAFPPPASPSASLLSAPLTQNWSASVPAPRTANGG